MKTYKINPLLNLELESNNETIINFFDTKFSELFDGEQDINNLVSIKLLEKDKLSIDNPCVLREITIPQLCLFDDDNFYIIKNKKKILIPFGDIGVKRNLTIFFETGFPLDWIRRFLEDVLDFHFVGLGAVFVHGACVIKGDTEVLIPAWRGTGKTSFTLHLLNSEKYSYKAEDQFFMFSNQETYLFTDATHVDYKTISSYPSLKKYQSISFWLRSLVVRLTLPIIPPTGVVFDFIRRGIIKVFAPKIFIKLREVIPVSLSHSQVERKLVLQLITKPDITSIEVKEKKLQNTINTIISGMLYERLDLFPFYYAWSYSMGTDNKNFSKYHEKANLILKGAFVNAKFFEIKIPHGYDWSRNFKNIQNILEGDQNY